MPAARIDGGGEDTKKVYFLDPKVDFLNLSPLDPYQKQ